MGNVSVAQFISDMRAEGKSDGEITKLLLENGWQIDVINKAVHGEPIRTRNLTPVLKTKNVLILNIGVIVAVPIILTLLVLVALYI